MADDRERGHESAQRTVPDSAQRSTSRESGPGASREGAQTQQANEDEIMKIRKQAGSIAEVVEPVQRTRLERTDR